MPEVDDRPLNEDTWTPAQTREILRFVAYVMMVAPAMVLIYVIGKAMVLAYIGTFQEDALKVSLISMFILGVMIWLATMVAQNEANTRREQEALAAKLAAMTPEEREIWDHAQIYDGHGW